MRMAVMEEMVPAALIWAWAIRPGTKTKDTPLLSAMLLAKLQLGVLAMLLPMAQHHTAKTAQQDGTNDLTRKSYIPASNPGNEKYFWIGHEPEDPHDIASNHFTSYPRIL